MRIVKFLILSLSIIILAEIVILSSMVFKLLSHNRSVGKTEAVRNNTIQPSATRSDRIAFVSDRNGGHDIYIMNPENRETVNITHSPGNDMNPQISPDGRFMVFYSDRDGDNDIYRLELDTGKLTQLTDNPADDYDPSYSTKGDRIVFKSTRDDKLGDIFIMNADGTGQKNLTPDRDNSEEWDPVFSIDGKKIIFVVRTGSDHLKDEIFIMDVDGSNIKQVTDNDIPDWYPSVNPIDGSIVFISKTHRNMTDDIFHNNPLTLDRDALTKLPGNDADPSWNLTGEKIIFINDSDGDYDLYIMNADGSGIEKIQNTDSDELSPVFLPVQL